ncbi:carbohydrate kinase-like protein [Thermacetogenium phaeum DSM 12270]|uniref:Bifunctional NAD(P)H-hydrate repair enzyme n=2 Tax=Thermacetogenium phaeum TaxID=85874 RepID=K4LVL2_THEPS|nr:bifunctional ADP-dependent NAD(P)H-hydrate dehydratase/NAD(P)H-hydrate epimerase [Thermacetogenium phaeum]AFV12054.1 carbohydrate kinase-like protein [Thermacetogenium phaeum DSM 12270]KUK36206.1 MAG: Carbohydrate kinase-like protein [Thermacetogenium phaeum]
MRLVQADEMRELDREATRRFGIPGLLLMENAGLSIVDVILKRFWDNKPQGKRILILAGPGNNGGDGFVVGRHLFNRGAEVKILITAPPDSYGGDAEVNLKIVSEMGIPLRVLEPERLREVEEMLAGADLVLDALFGTGFRGVPREPVASLIRLVNKAGKAVVAVDLPSGLEADTGRVAGDCVRAQVTVTMGMPKIGLYLEPGAQYAGEVVVGDISFPPELKTEEGGNYYLVDEEMVAAALPERLPTQHKGDFGHVLVIGGTRGYTGAAALASNAALRSGAGLVTAVVPEDLYPVAAAKLTEVMTFPAPGKDGGFDAGACAALMGLFGRATVLAVGPGLGQGEGTVSFLRELLERTDLPAVLDADALNILARDRRILTDPLFAERRKRWILTPHPGEMARLCGTGVGEIQSDRIGVAVRASREWGTTVVLKGARTVIAAPGSPVFINPTGNPGLASGGTGDVLAGLVAGLLAQGIAPVEAAFSGAFIHGLAADRIARQKGMAGLVAGDLLEEIPVVLELLARRKRSWRG